MDIQSINDRIRGLVTTHATRGMSHLQAARAIVGSLPMVVRSIVTAKTTKPIKIVLVEPSETARTDCTSYIMVPRLPVPTSANDVDFVMDGVGLTMGLIHHEVGHVNHTDISVTRSAPAKARFLFNIVEDVRMENAHIKDMPGARRYMDATNWVLRKRHCWGVVPTVDHHPAVILHSYVMSYLNANFRNDPASQDAVSPTQAVMDALFTPTVRKELDAILDGFPSITNTAESLELVEAILNFLKQQQQKSQEQPEQQQSQQAGSQEDSSESGSNQEEGRGSGNSASSSSKTDGEGQSTASDSSDVDGEPDSAGAGSNQDTGDSTEEGSKGDGQSSGMDSSNAYGQLDSPGKGSSGTGSLSLGERLSMAIEGDPSDSSTGDKHDVIREAAEHYASLSSSTLNLSEAMKQIEAANSFKAKKADNLPWLGACYDLDSVNGVSMGIRRRMLNELDAITHSKVHTGRRGRALSSRHLHRVSSGEDKVFQTRIEGQSLSASIMLVQDVSGSMSYDNRIGISSKALYATAQAFEGIDGVEVAAMAFPGNGKVIGFGEQVRRNKARFQLVPNGGTPMASAIMTAVTALLNQDSERKIMIVLTDGAPDNSASTKAMIAMAESQSIEVFAIGIQTDAVRDLFEHSTVISSLETLPQHLVAMVRSKVIPIPLN